VGVAAEPAVVGVADHSGWANLVTVAAPGGRPVVVDRRRCELIGADLPRQPYHAAQGLSAVEAVTLVDRVRAGADLCARQALAGLVAELDDHRLVGVAVRAPGGRPLPGTVADVLASHSAMHAAEGQLYRDALAEAAAELAIAVATFERKALSARAEVQLGLSVAEVASLAAELGRPLGAPWRAEHKEAALAALCELADHVPVHGSAG
jgi:hypothetical protein